MSTVWGVRRIYIGYCAPFPCETCLASEDGGGAKAKFGVPGLDIFLRGGLSPRHVFLVEGSPRTAKTTIALRFLLAVAEKGETGLDITHSEDAIRRVPRSHGGALRSPVGDRQWCQHGR